MISFMAQDYSTPSDTRRPAWLQRWAPLAATLLVVALTARLGLWQLDRAEQKRTLQARMDERRALPPITLADWPAARAGDAAWVDRAITLRGRWLHAGTVYLDNRQMNGRPGFYVLTPLRLDGAASGGDAVMVQRGWIPRDPLERSRLPALPQDGGEVELHGRIAPPPSRLYDFGDAGQGPIRQNLDLAAHAAGLQLALRPASVVQTDPPAPAEAPLQRDWPAIAVDVHKHLGYATQWFALSATSAGLYVWFQLIRPRLRRRRQPR